MKYSYNLRNKRNRYNSFRKSTIQSHRKYQMGGSVPAPNSPSLELLTNAEQEDIAKLIEGKLSENIPKLLEYYTGDEKIYPFIRTYKAEKLKEMGFTLNDFIGLNVLKRFLYIQGFRDALPRTFQHIFNEGFKKSVFRDAGVGINELRGLTVAQLKTLQFTADDFKNATTINYGVPSLRIAGFPAKELMLANFDLFDIITGGFTAQELQGAGITAQQLKDARITAQQLKDAGITAQYLKDAGITAQVLTDAGFKLRDIFELLGYTYGDIHDLYKALHKDDIEKVGLNRILGRCPRAGIHRNRNCTYESITGASTGGKYHNKRSRRIMRK